METLAMVKVSAINILITGTYTVTMRVEDGDGATDSLSRDIVVLNVKPIANFTHKPRSPVGIKKMIAFSDTSIDLDGYIANWTWDFGDEVTAYGNQTNHTYTKAGTYNVTLTVIDNDGDIDSYTMTITVEKEGFEVILWLLIIAFAVLIGCLIIFKRRKKNL